MAAGWTIQQITHCSESLLCSDSLANSSNAVATGEADVATIATIVKGIGKSLAATVTSTATLDTLKVTPVTVGGDQQDVAALVACVGGGVGV